MKEKLLMILIKKVLYVFVLVPLLSLMPIKNLYTTTNSEIFASAPNIIETWWPQDGGTYSGTVTFKAIVSGKNLNEYQMRWQVDDGVPTTMLDSLQDYPHKEASVDVSTWTWKGIGPYRVTFSANDLSNNRIAEKTINIYSAGAVSVPSSTDTKISIWWPKEETILSGIQPLKGVIDGKTVDQYRLFYSLDGGTKIEMPNSFIDHPHKEISVDTTTWTGVTHTIIFSATDTNNNPIGERRISVSTPISTTTTQVSTPSSTNPFRDTRFYINPYSNAAQQIIKWQTTRPLDAAQLQKISSQPDAEWFGNWNSNIEEAVKNYRAKTETQQAVPIMVAYNIPNRDCGSYSAGGATSGETYLSWVKGFARGIGSAKAIVILEPDALPGLGCLSNTDQNTRLMLLKDAVKIFKANTGTAVYIDAGHANWISVDETVRRLEKAGISIADGFSLNISNFITTEKNTAFGTAVSEKINGKHFIIDTSRNGNGSNGEWCNPSGRALGTAPTSRTSNSLIDAFFWIKKPGDSDGSCNGAPSAGTWMPEYALEMARNTL